MENEEIPAQFSLASFYAGSLKARWIDRVIVALLILLIIGSPLPFGSVQHLPIFVIEAIALLACLLWVFKLATYGDPAVLNDFRILHAGEKKRLRQFAFLHRHRWIARALRTLSFGHWPRRNVAENLIQDEAQTVPRRTHYHSLLGFPVKNTGLEPVILTFLVLLLIQLIPLPSVLFAVLSPATRDLYQSAARVTEESIQFHPISLDPTATLAKLLQYAAYAMIYLVVVNNIRTRVLFAAVLYAIFISGVFQGVYGLYEFLSGHQHIFAYKKIFNEDVATGTFINRNHYAAYLEMSLPLLITVVIGRFVPLRSFRGNIFVRISHAFETQGSQVLLLAFMIVLVAVSLIFSLSRSGITFGIISLMTFFLLYWKARETLTRKALLTLSIAATLAFAVWIGLNPVIERFLKISENWELEGARWDVWKNTFNMFLHFPLAGTGAGTFEQVFPMYRTFMAHVVFDYAHNDYLQFLSETGLLTFFLMVAIADLILTRIHKILFKRQLNRLGIVQLGAFCSMLSLAMHSLTDFSFQIPAVAVAACVVTGLFFSHYHAENRGITR
jgi:O-antigen ligase